VIVVAASLRGRGGAGDPVLGPLAPLDHPRFPGTWSP